MPRMCECPHCRGFRQANPPSTGKDFLEARKALEKVNTPKAASD